MSIWQKIFNIDKEDKQNTNVITEPVTEPAKHKIIINSIADLKNIKSLEDAKEKEDKIEVFQEEYAIPDLEILETSQEDLRPYVEAIKQEKDLAIPIGKCKDQVIVEPLNRMPNLLISGTVMSGKSTYINFCLATMLLTKSATDLKLIIYDSKGIEYSQYSGAPHLLFPIISNEKLLYNALLRTKMEIERRYAILQNRLVKTVDQYNEKPDATIGKLPNIVVIIDNYSDLNSTNEINEYIDYISKNGWNVNIHLIVVSNYPSPQIISTVSAANFPTRICFRVTTKKESILILNASGAEKIKGIGNALYSSRFSNSLQNIEIPLIAENDIKRIIYFFIERYKMNFLWLDFIKNPFIEEKEIETEDMEYKKVLEFVIRTQIASASLLQRKFQLGYNKAARMIDRLEEDGIIGPASGTSKPREVLVQFADTEEDNL